jgi:hypothetical protein
LKIHFGRQQVKSEDSFETTNFIHSNQGKGFWVGLVMIVTGLVGILASRELTPPSIVGFTTLASVSTILSFYLMITCIIPVQYDTTYSDTSRPTWQLTELTINSFLIAVSAFGSILGSITSLIGCCFAGCCANQRDNPRYSKEVDRIIISTNPGTSEHGTPYAARRDYPPQ